MEIQGELELEGPLTVHELRRRHRDGLLRAAGIRPATGKWPPPEFEPIQPRFYRVRRMFWPVRRFLRRFA